MVSKSDGSAPPLGEKARRWRRDEDAEQIVEKYTSGTVVGYAWVRIKEIDATTDVNARHEKGRVSPERMDEYRAAMKAGDIFPAAVVMRRKHRPYGLLGGFTRLTLARELGDEFVYVLVLEEMSETDAAPARARLNMNHGLLEDKETIYRLAVQAVTQNRGLSVKAVASRYGINARTLATHVRVERVRIEMRDHGISLTPFGLNFVKLIEHDCGPVRVALASLLASARPKVKESVWQEGVKQVKEASSEAAALAKIDELRAEWNKPTKRKPLKAKRGEALAKHLGTAEYQFDDGELSPADVPPELLDVIRDRWLRLSSKMSRLLCGLPAREAS